MQTDYKKIIQNDTSELGSIQGCLNTGLNNCFKGTYHCGYLRFSPKSEQKDFSVEKERYLKEQKIEDR